MLEEAQAGSSDTQARPSYLCDLREAGLSQSQGRRSGLQAPIPEGSVLSSRALQSVALYPDADPLSPPVK